MRWYIRTLSIAGMLALGLGIPGGGVAIAGPLEDANAAYQQKDYATAIKLLRPLADAGDVTAQNGLGVMYLDGQGVAKDTKEAVKWYRLAAAQGDASAQRMLGNIFYGKDNVRDDGIASDLKESFKWFRLAAEQRDASAQFRVGAYYAQGLGVAKNEKEAVKWYRLSAAQGYVHAQHYLGTAYANGSGVARDVVMAHIWLELAAAQGDADAAKKRDIIAANMTPDESENAQMLGYLCETSGYKDCDF